MTTHQGHGLINQILHYLVVLLILCCIPVNATEAGENKVSPFSSKKTSPPKKQRTQVPDTAIKNTSDLLLLFGDQEFVTIPQSSLLKSYRIGKYEVTQKQWMAVMGNNPSFFNRCGDNCPVEQVSWNDIQIFIQRLNSKTGKQFRLPTDLEWELACQGNFKRESSSCGSNNADSVAWYNANSDAKTHPVGQKQPTPRGVYDMSGNVWEWVQDWYNKDLHNSNVYSYHAERIKWATNPASAPTGTERLLRGGSWFFGREDVNFFFSRSQLWFDPSYSSFMIGFRLAQD